MRAPLVPEHVCTDTCAGVARRIDAASRRCVDATRLLCRAALPGVAGVGGMLQLEPRILSTDIEGLLSEIERLLPGQDPKALLIQNPSVRPSAPPSAAVTRIPSLFRV